MFGFLLESNNISYATIGSEFYGDLVMDISGEGTSFGTPVISLEKQLLVTRINFDKRKVILIQHFPSPETLKG